MSEASLDSPVPNPTRRPWLDGATLEELQAEIGSDTVEAMLISFDAEATRRVEMLLNTDLPNADTGRGAHALMGMALSVGAFALGDAARALEQACSTAQRSVMDALRTDLALCSRATGVAVRAWLAGDEIDA